jgi:hypothetical protein
MNHYFLRLGAWAGCLLGTVAAARAQAISVYSNDCALNFSVSADHHWNFKSLGTRQESLDYPGGKQTAYPTNAGNKPLENASVVALSAVHADQSTATDLLFVSDSKRNVEPGVTETRFNLRDKLHPFNVTVTLYQTDIRPIVQAADLYRLESPYDGSRASRDFVLPDKSKAILFAWQMQDDTSSGQKTIKLQGLDPQQGYRVTEVDLESGTTSQLPANGTVVKGSVLMSTGLIVPTTKYLQSSVIELTAAR